MEPQANQLFHHNNDGSSCAKVRMLCFPGAGASSTFFSDWACHLLPDVDMYTLSLPGRGHRFSVNAYSHVDNLLRDITSILRDQWSDKPFVFYGHSFGAYLAFCLAKHLEETKVVAPVALFLSATPAPQSVARKRLLETVRGIRSDEEFAEFVSQSVGDAVPEELMADEEWVKEILVPPFRADTNMCLQLSDKTFEVVPPLSCPIYYMDGREDRSFLQDSEAWRKMTRGHFHSKILPGGHNFVLVSENYINIIRLIKNAVNEIL